MESLLPDAADVRPAVAAVAQGLVHARAARFGPDAAPLNIPVAANGRVMHGPGPEGMAEGPLLDAALAAAEEAISLAEAAHPLPAAAAAAVGAAADGDSGVGVQAEVAAEAEQAAEAAGLHPHHHLVQAHAAAARAVRSADEAAAAAAAAAGDAGGSKRDSDGDGGGAHDPPAQLQKPSAGGDKAAATAAAPVDALPFGLVWSPAAYPETETDQDAQTRDAVALMGLFDGLAVKPAEAKVEGKGAGKKLRAQKSYAAPLTPQSIARHAASGHVANVLLAAAFVAQQQLGGGVTEAAILFLLQRRRSGRVRLAAKSKAKKSKSLPQRWVGDLALVTAVEQLPGLLAELVARGVLSAAPCAWPTLGTTYCPAAPPPDPQLVEDSLSRPDDRGAAAIVVADAVHRLCSEPGAAGADLAAFVSGIDGALARQLPSDAPSDVSQSMAALAMAAPSEVAYNRLSAEACALWKGAPVEPSMVGSFLVGRAPAPAAVAESVRALCAAAPAPTKSKRDYKGEAQAAHQRALKELAPPPPVAPGVAFGAGAAAAAGGAAGEGGKKGKAGKKAGKKGGKKWEAEEEEGDAVMEDGPAAAGGGAPLAVFEDRKGATYSLTGGRMQWTAAGAAAAAAATAPPATAQQKQPAQPKAAAKQPAPQQQLHKRSGSPLAAALQHLLWDLVAAGRREREAEEEAAPLGGGDAWRHCPLRKASPLDAQRHAATLLAALAWWVGASRAGADGALGQSVLQLAVQAAMGAGTERHKAAVVAAKKSSGAATGSSPEQPAATAAPPAHDAACARVGAGGSLPTLLQSLVAAGHLEAVPASAAGASDGELAPWLDGHPLAAGSLHQMVAEAAAEADAPAPADLTKAALKEVQQQADEAAVAAAALAALTVPGAPAPDLLAALLLLPRAARELLLPEEKPGRFRESRDGPIDGAAARALNLLLRRAACLSDPPLMRRFEAPAGAKAPLTLWWVPRPPPAAAVQAAVDALAAVHPGGGPGAWKDWSWGKVAVAPAPASCGGCVWLTKEELAAQQGTLWFPNLPADEPPPGGAHEASPPAADGGGGPATAATVAAGRKRQLAETTPVPAAAAGGGAAAETAAGKKAKKRRQPAEERELDDVYATAKAGDAGGDIMVEPADDLVKRDLVMDDLAENDLEEEDASLLLAGLDEGDSAEGAMVGSDDSDDDDDDDSSSYEEEEEEEPAAAAAAAAPAAAAKGGRVLQGAQPLYPEMHAKALAALASQPPPPQQQQQQQQQHHQQQQQPRTALHEEVAAFARRCAPTPRELDLLRVALRDLNAAAAALWPDARVLLFGSQAGGLSLPGSDLDLVVICPGGPVAKPADGFSVRERRDVVLRLQRLKKELQRRGLLYGKDPVNVIQARVSRWVVADVGVTEGGLFAGWVVCDPEACGFEGSGGGLRDAATQQLLGSASRVCPSSNSRFDTQGVQPHVCRTSQCDSSQRHSATHSTRSPTPTPTPPPFPPPRSPSSRRPCSSPWGGHSPASTPTCRTARSTARRRWSTWSDRCVNTVFYSGFDGVAMS
jgi:hypothetical protein